MTNESQTAVIQRGKRASKQVYEEMKKNVARARERLRKADVLREGVGSEFWGVVTEFVNAKLKSVDRELLNFKNKSPEERVLLLQQKEDLVMFRDMPESFGGGYEALGRSLSEKEKRLRDYERRLSATHS